ncbi:MAG TPA: hypothetical protein VGZ26_08285, partial [Pirellulales bacterium]|nr:hypothetical protein [Pirellulales bacterium]
MDELRPAAPPDLGQARASQVSPNELRRRAHEILSTQRSQLDRFEHELNDRLQHLADKVAEDLASNQAEQSSANRQSVESTQLEPLRQQLAAREAELDATRAELDETRIAAKRLDQDARIRESLLAESQREQQQRRIALANVQEQLADVQAQSSAQLEPLRRQLAAREAELEAARAELDETRIAAKRLD